MPKGPAVSDQVPKGDLSDVSAQMFSEMAELAASVALWRVASTSRSLPLRLEDWTGHRFMAECASEADRLERL